jgi:hypothetical protein
MQRKPLTLRLLLSQLPSLSKQPSFNPAPKSPLTHR